MTRFSVDPGPDLDAYLGSLPPDHLLRTALALHRLAVGLRDGDDDEVRAVHQVGRFVRRLRSDGATWFEFRLWAVDEPDPDPAGVW